jgi:hypothetical protein
LTEYTDKNGERRVRWGTTEWIIGAIISALGVAGLGTGIAVSATDANQTTQIEVNKTDIQSLKRSAARWDQAANLLERIDERTGQIQDEIGRIRDQGRQP